MGYFKSKQHIENAINSLIIARERIDELKKERHEKYNINPNLCLCCKKPLKYEKKNTKFCSQSCSATFNNKKRVVSEKQKIKTSLALINKSRIHYYEKLQDYKRICLHCNEEFVVKRKENRRLSAQKYCSKECASLGMRLNVSKSQKELVRKGLHKGWQSRNVLSYPEKFFMNVLKNNNLEYKHNFIVNKRDLGLDDVSNYFLDFYFEDKKIDLEIDGKQHSYEVRKESDEIRDSNLSKIGIQVYRIKWKSINKKEGRDYIKNEIDKFIKIIK